MTDLGAEVFKQHVKKKKAFIEHRGWELGLVVLSCGVKTQGKRVAF